MNTEHVKHLGSANGVKSTEYQAAEQASRAGSHSEIHVGPDGHLVGTYESGHGHLFEGLFWATVGTAGVVLIGVAVWMVL